jgi:hypothetical protein
MTLLKIVSHKFRDDHGVESIGTRQKNNTGNGQVATGKGAVGNTTGTAVTKAEVLQLKLKIQNPKYVQRKLIL